METRTRSLDCPTPVTVAELVAALPGPVVVVGDTQRKIRCIAPLEAMCPGSLSFARTAFEEVARRLGPLDGAVIITPLDGIEQVNESVTLIKVAQPRDYFIRALYELIGPERMPEPGISPAATIAPDARIGTDVHIGPGALVGSGACVGERSVLFSGAQVLRGVELGAGVIIQANSVIGAHGQSYVRHGDGGMLVMPHYASVVVGPRTRIGANATVVRGTLRDTVIGSDSSIGNNANIGHNTVLGERCFVGPGVVLTGSSIVGDDTWISAGAIVCGVALGRGVTVGAGSVVTRAVADHGTVNGMPARLTASQGS